jgi:hypothetical protein
MPGCVVNNSSQIAGVLPINAPLSDFASGSAHEHADNNDPRCSRF